MEHKCRKRHMSLQRSDILALCKRNIIHTVLILCTIAASAQCPPSSLEGRSFSVMFLTNYGVPELSLIAAGRHNATITVQNPRTGYQQTVHLTGGQSVTIPIPDEQGNTTNDGALNSTGLVVTSTSDISLYASNFQDASFDIATVIPTAALGTEYMAQTYSECSFDNCEVGFMATEDSTILTITMPDGTELFSPSGQRYTLMAAQTLQLSLQAMAEPFGFSGLHVVSNDKPFAMFQGNQCTQVPAGQTACDHLYEQCLPVERCGKTFVLVPTARNGRGERVRVTSLHDFCTVSYDGNVNTLPAGGTIEYSLPSGGAKMLTTTKEAIVCIYLSGIYYGGGLGDPAMVTVPPVEQGVRSATFNVINTNLTTAHYTNIITPTRYVRYMQLDNIPIDTAFITMGNGYSYTQLPVTPGTHTLHADTGRFTAIFYGLGRAESYAYIAGMGLRRTGNRLLVDGIDDLSSNAEITVCQGDSVDLEFTSQDTLLMPGWYVNGTFITNNRRHLRYAFDSAGRFEVMNILYSICDTLITYVTVFPKYLDTFYDTVCENTTYTWRSHQIDGGGFFADTLKTKHGCDSIVGLNLKRTSYAHPTLTVDNDCKRLNYRLEAFLEDTTMTSAIRWFSSPHDNTTDSSAGHSEIFVSPSSPTKYSLTLSVECSDTATVLLTPVTIPQAAMKLLPEVLDYDRPYCTAVDISKFNDDRIWKVDGTEMGSDKTLHAYANMENDSMVLTLVAFNNYCTDTVERVVPIAHTTMWAPNVFSPGLNDNGRFKITSNKIEQLGLYIYNREGLLVFATDNPEEGWDGCRQGTPMPQGAYVWKLTYLKEGYPLETHIAVGTVTLLR